MSRIYSDLRKKASAESLPESRTTPSDDDGGDSSVLPNQSVGDGTTPRPWIQTFGGRQFHFPPDLAEIFMESIAHALSCVNRFTGHAIRPYSVAEHSVRVSARAEEIASGYEPKVKLMIARWGLIHDFSEAFTSDINSPLKKMKSMEGFRDIESDIMKVVCQKYGLPEQMPEEVKRADMQVFFAEAEQVMTPLHPAFKGEFGDKWNPIPLTSNAGFRPWGFGWVQAKSLFLNRWKALFGDVA